MKKNLFITTALLLAASGVNASAETLAEKIDKLEQEIQLLKRQNEVAEEKQKTASEKFAKVEYGNKGLVITSPDGNSSLKLRGYAQVDERTFLDNESNNNTSQFLVRSARPILEGTFDKNFTGRLMLDFGGGQTRLLDAYADYKPDEAFNIRAGKFKTPIGLERWQSEQELISTERGSATNLVPFRDIGLMFYGDIIPQTLEYQLALVNGSADLVDTSSDVDGGKDVIARVFTHPFRDSEIVDLQGLGFGVAGSYGQRDGTTTNTALTDGYRTAGQARFFTFSSGTFGDGATWRINPQAYYYNGPVGLLTEYVHESQELRNGATKDDVGADAFTAVATYVLTGENSSFDGVKPAENFNYDQGTWGAWEVLAKIGSTKIDKDAFPVFASAASSANKATEGTIGLNWYLNNSLKINNSFTLTNFDGGAAGGTDREDEKVLITRAQFRF